MCHIIVSHTQQSCRTYERVMSHAFQDKFRCGGRYPHFCRIFVCRMKKSCRTYERVMSHYESVIPHMLRCHVVEVWEQMCTHVSHNCVLYKEVMWCIPKVQVVEWMRTRVLHTCCTLVAHLLHTCCTLVAQLLHSCCTLVS